MGTRLELQDELLQFLPNVYFQPPSSEKMIYPCIVYQPIDMDIKSANDNAYLINQAYRVTLIERDPDSGINKQLIRHFRNCSLDQQFRVDNLHQTALTIYY